ncbi:MAG: ATP-grasp domain-containing protein [Taibaiella sp.]|nr:ATP-grasp domain-containing protein [Taibaiella sp.]
MFSSKHALVVAGGQWQVPLINFLQKRGYKVTVADPFDSSPGVMVADAHVKADVRDYAGILSAVAGQKFDLITTDQSDIAVETVAALAQHFGVKAMDPDVIRKFTNKYESRQFAGKIGMPVPAYGIAHSLAEVQQQIERLGLPVILKPVDAQSSRGIFMINEQNHSALAEMVAQTFKESRADHILVEQFFVGTELTVEGICSGGKHKTLAVSEKRHFRTGIASDLIYPAHIPGQVWQQIVELNDKYVEESGLEFGITHAEYLYNRDSGEICLVEIACRGGGTLISSHITNWVAGVNVYDMHVSNLEGGVTDVRAIQCLKRSAVLHFFEFPNGTVKKISGLDAIRVIDGVAMIKLDFTEGSVIKAANDDRSRQGFVIVLADDPGELKHKLDQIIDLLKVEIGV